MINILRIRNIFFFVLLLCLLAAGCKEQQKQHSSAPYAPNYPIEKKFSKGPVTVHLQLSADQLTVAEELTLTVKAIVPEDLEVTFPQFQTSFGDFTLKETKPLPKELDEKGLVLGRTWILTPYLPGEYTTAGLTVSAKPAQSGGAPIVIDIPPQTVTVTSFLDPAEEAPDIADIVDPVSLPMPRHYFLLAGLAVLTFCAFIFFLLRRKKRKLQNAPPPIPAHIKALDQINRLVAQRKEKVQYSFFFAELTLILRQYIEERFGLQAPEQTTEEFLDALQNTSAFSGEEKALLQHFLSRCDLIKFAQMVPAQQEVDESIALCRNFITTTAEKIPAGNNQGGRQ